MAAWTVRGNIIIVFTKGVSGSAFSATASGLDRISNRAIRMLPKTIGIGIYFFIGIISISLTFVYRLARRHRPEPGLRIGDFLFSDA